MRREPQALKGVLKRDQYLLYNLIWQRMVASQMKDAVYDVITVEVEARPQRDKDVYAFRASETSLRFAGYRQLYREYAEEGEEGEEKRHAAGAGRG